MTNTPFSPIEAVKAAINSHNPFTNAVGVSQQNIWGKGLPDVSTLNAHASNKVFEAIEFVRKGKSNKDKVTSIVITAPTGVGKTHLLSRIRHELEKQGGALFVYSGVSNYTDLNLVKYQFQQTLADSLNRTGSQQVLQWQEVAAAMANEGKENALSPEELVKKFDQAYKNSLAKNRNLMNALQNQVMKNKPDADPYIVRAILWTLSQTQVSFAKLWLSGEELSQSDADKLGLPNPSKTNQDKETEALKNIQQILNLVSFYNPVVICFDEIDILNNCNEDGLTTELVIANLVKILHDTLENSELSKGVVILTVMMPETWKNVIHQQQKSTSDKISKYTQRKPIELDPLSADSMVQLVTVWLEEYYNSKNLTPPHPLYPFEETQLRDYGKKKPTVREALQWCANNFKTGRVSDDPFERFELAFTRESEVKFEEYIEDSSRIAEALYFGFKTLKGQTLECVMIEEITNDIKPRARNNNFINFKIIGKENGKQVKIGVAVIQDSQVTLKACLTRLNDYHTFDLTRGCLVRSESKIKQMKKTAATFSLLEELIKHKGGENVDLIEDQIRPLVAILAIYEKRENYQYQLTEEQIFDIISKNNITFDNLLLREILSNPSGNMPEVNDEDIIDEFLTSPNMYETEDSDDTSDLFG